MKKHIPNTITCCNLISGCIATYWAFNSEYELALLFIVIGAVFDFFDGMTARLLHVSSPIGKELDSLADDITFGFAPSAIIFSWLSGYHFHELPSPIHRRSRTVSDLISHLHLRHHCRHAVIQLFAHCRAAHVCIEV